MSKNLLTDTQNITVHCEMKRHVQLRSVQLLKGPVASPAASSISTAALLGALNCFRMGSPKKRQIHTKFVH